VLHKHLTADCGSFGINDLRRAKMFMQHALVHQAWSQFVQERFDRYALVCSDCVEEPGEGS